MQNIGVRSHMKIILAPDSFKGSCSAFQIASAMERGIRSVYPEAQIVSLPMADGGEGTMDIIIRASGGFYVEATVHDPLCRPIKARYGVAGTGKLAVIELAEASGLSLLQASERNPLVTSTYGTGELIRHALDAGYRDFVICLGGSGTNDGGAGMLQALGMKLLDGGGMDLGAGGANLAQLAAIDDSAFDHRIEGSRFVIAGDVRNPLCGASGASAIYGPQKGASPEAVQLLDSALAHYADVIRHFTGVDVKSVPGSGAAGGAAAALLAYFHASMRSGAHHVMELLRFDEQLEGADWIITGEGRLDEQTASGKAIAAVCEAAKVRRIPVIALCGMIEASPAYTAELGLRACFTLVPGPCSLGEAFLHAEEWISDRMTHIFRLL